MGGARRARGGKGTSSRAADITARLTDPKSYSGSHKARFDPETGRGRGRSPKRSDPRPRPSSTGSQTPRATPDRTRSVSTPPQERAAEKLAVSTSSKTQATSPPLTSHASAALLPVAVASKKV